MRTLGYRSEGRRGMRGWWRKECRPRHGRVARTIPMRGEREHLSRSSSTILSMIKEITRYAVACDRCGWWDPYAVADDEELAKEAAKVSGFREIEVDNDWICPDCWRSSEARGSVGV